MDRRALWTRVGAFSGGNQQKIAIAKWLLAESRVLLLFDPTRGIDVGTKNELYRLIRAYADAGGAVLFHSTEIAEARLSLRSDACLLRRSDRLRDSGGAALGGGNSARGAGRRRRSAEGGVTMATAATRPGEPVAARRRSSVSRGSGGF